MASNEGYFTRTHTFWTPELEARVLTAFERFAQNGELSKTDFVHAWNNCDLESSGSKRDMEAVFDKLDVLNQERIDRRKYIIGVKHQIIKSNQGVNPFLAKKSAKPHRHPAHRYRLYITAQHEKWFCNGYNLPGGCRSVNRAGFITSPTIDCYACRRKDFKLCVECFQDKTRRFPYVTHGMDASMFDLEALTTQFDTEGRKFDNNDDLLEFVFHRFDGDASGEIDNEEFRAAYQYLGADGSSKEFIKVFNDMDTDGSGTISMSEFKEFVYMSERKGKMEEERQQEKQKVREMVRRNKSWIEIARVLRVDNEPDGGEAYVQRVFDDLEDADTKNSAVILAEDELAPESPEIIYSWTTAKTKLMVESIDAYELMHAYVLIEMHGMQVFGKVIDVPASEHLIVTCYGHSEPFAIRMHDPNLQIAKKETPSEQVRRIHADHDLELPEVARLLDMDIMEVERLLEEKEDVVVDEIDSSLLFNKSRKEVKFQDRARMEQECRRNWQVGSKLEVFSQSQQQWFRAVVNQINQKASGEDELQVLYNQGTQGALTKKVKRYNNDTRPIGFEEQAHDVEIFLTKNVKQEWVLSLEDAYRYFPDFPNVLISNEYGKIYVPRAEEIYAKALEHKKMPIVSKHGLGVMAISESGMIATGSMDRNLRLFRRSRPTEETIFGLETFSTNAGITAIDITRDGSLVATGLYDSRVELWEINRCKRRTAPKSIVPIELHARWVVNCCKFTPSNARLAIGGGRGDRAVRIWDLESQQLDQGFAECSDSVDHLAFSEDGNIMVVTSQDRLIRMFDRRSAKIIQSWQFGEQFVCSHKGLVNVTEGTKGTQFIATHDNSLGFFEFGYDEPVEKIRFNDTITAMDMHGPVLCVGCNDGYLRFYETTNQFPKEMHSVLRSKSIITDCKWYDDLSVVSVGHDCSIRVDSFIQELTH